MEGPGDFPDILAFPLAFALKKLGQQERPLRIVRTLPQGNPGHGPERVVRQRITEDGNALEITVAVEDWGKEV